MDFLKLFIAASIPVLNVLLVTGLGSFLALERINILGEDARKHLNNLVFYVSNPALIGGNLADTITYDSMISLWFMPFNVLITFIVGSALGWVVILITRAPPHLRGLVVGCCAAGNMGNMLLIIIPAICKEKGSPFGDPDTCHTYGVAYVSLSMAICAIYLWSYVYNIVRISSRGCSREVEINDCSVGNASGESSTSKGGDCKEPLLSSENVSASGENENIYSLPCTRFEEKAQVPLTEKIMHWIRMLVAKMNLKPLLAPSTTGAIIGFVVGLVPQLRKLMIGDAAPLRVIQDSTRLLGDVAVPVLTLIVGGNLLKGLKGSEIRKSVIVGIVIARYIALPLVGIVIVRGAYRFGLVPTNPLYQFVLLIQYAVPPAMNIGTITQVFGTGETECSVVMLWTYALASVSLTLWSTFFMVLVA